VKGLSSGQGQRAQQNILQNEYALRIAPELGQGYDLMKVVDESPVQYRAVLQPCRLEALLARFEAGDGDVLLMIADTSRDLVNRVLCGLSSPGGKARHDPQAAYCPLWVTNFPSSRSKKKRSAPSTTVHHAGSVGLRSCQRAELVGLRSRAYDSL